MWKRAVTGYAIAAPLIVASPICYAIFWDSMMMGEVCKFYELANESIPEAQDNCLYYGTVTTDDPPVTVGPYSQDPQFYIDASGFRYYAFMMALWVPACFYLLEFMMNQLLMSWKNIAYQYVFTLVYAAITATWQIVTSNAVIFPQRLDWICDSRPGASADCLFSECFAWFLWFMLI